MLPPVQHYIYVLVFRFYIYKSELKNSEYTKYKSVFSKALALEPEKKAPSLSTIAWQTSVWVVKVFRIYNLICREVSIVESASEYVSTKPDCEDLANGISGYKFKFYKADERQA